MEAVVESAKIFDPVAAGRKMQTLPCGSCGGSNIRAMIKGATNYQVVAILYDRLSYHGSPCKIPEIAQEADVPRIFVDSSDVMKNRHNEQVRKDYYKRVIDEIESASARYGFHVDLIPLGGFMLLLSEPVLSYYKDKIINVHPADLAACNPDGRRRYTGDRAVLNVVKDMLTSTKSSIHVVIPEVDGGDIIAQKGMAISYPQGTDAWTEQDWNMFAGRIQDDQKKWCDWPAYVAALRMIADGRFALGREKNTSTGLRTVFLDGVPLPYGGHQLTEVVDLG